MTTMVDGNSPQASEYKVSLAIWNQKKTNVEDRLYDICPHTLLKAQETLYLWPKQLPVTSTLND